MDGAELLEWQRSAAKGGIGKCTAVRDRCAETEEDLMFLKDDEIVVLMQVPDQQGVFLGFCEGVVGTFHSSDVRFHTLRLKVPAWSKRLSDEDEFSGSKLSGKHSSELENDLHPTSMVQFLPPNTSQDARLIGLSFMNLESADSEDEGESTDDEDQDWESLLNAYRGDVKDELRTACTQTIPRPISNEDSQSQCPQKCIVCGIAPGDDLIILNGLEIPDYSHGTLLCFEHSDIGPPSLLVNLVSPRTMAHFICDAWQKGKDRIVESFIEELDGNEEFLLRLRGNDAQKVADLLQEVIDSSKPDQGVLKHKFQRLLVKICQTRDVIPSSLFIKGVEREGSDAICGGSFGDVYRGTYRTSKVALKRIRIFPNTASEERQRTLQKLGREAMLWRALKHPFVLSFYGIDADTFPTFFCLVSPWMENGTILQHLEETRRQDVDLGLFEVAQGLAYLHSQDIVHGDIRGSNILVDPAGHACIADFGLAVFSDVTVGTNSSHHAGSVRWMAPELHFPVDFGLKYFRRTFATDVYSFACLCVELYTGKPPFEDVPRDTAALIKAVNGERPARPAEMVDWFWELVERCWCHDWTKRPSMSAVVEAMHWSQ